MKAAFQLRQRSRSDWRRRRSEGGHWLSPDARPFKTTAEPGLTARHLQFLEEAIAAPAIRFLSAFPYIECIRATGLNSTFKEGIMKFTTTLVTALAIVATMYSTASSAESGMPSRQEIGATPSVEGVSNDDGKVNDYARYLMVVDGKRRSDAVVEARNYPTSAYAKVAGPRNIGSYARYLMVVDGLRYEEAIAEATVQDGHHLDQFLVAR